ncbi:hypothetical protein V6B08_10910 [Ferrovibrio sp. MS7]|uniref:hypothetical protein n=1 Tax=Ferrovibrio plantarum TaxID=3119164 RepID=UPI0031351EBB
MLAFASMTTLFVFLVMPAQAGIPFCIQASIPFLHIPFLQIPFSVKLFYPSAAPSRPHPGFPKLAAKGETHG